MSEETMAEAEAACDCECQVHGMEGCDCACPEHSPVRFKLESPEFAQAMKAERDRLQREVIEPLEEKLREANQEKAKAERYAAACDQARRDAVATQHDLQGVIRPLVEALAGAVRYVPPSGPTMKLSDQCYAALAAAREHLGEKGAK